MRIKKFAAALAVAALACAAVVVFASPSITHVSSNEGKWIDGPVPGVQMIPIRGDLAKGAYAQFTKFAPGSDRGWHTHTNDVSLVVISGAYLYKDEDGKDLRVGPGEYFSIAGGHKHWSGGDAEEGCVFYQEGTKKFDLVRSEAPTGAMK